MKAISGADLVNKLNQYEGALNANTALIGGIGSTSGQLGDNAVAGNFIGMFTKTTAASGDSRGIYWRHYFNGAGSGEVARLWATVNYNGAASGGTINALHATMSVNASCAVSGAANAIRATIGAASATRTLGGTCAALQLDSDIGANNTVPKTWAFIRLSKAGSVDLTRFMYIEDDQVLANPASGAAYKSLVVNVLGTDYYINLQAAS
jgi:hypothetical protein